MEQVECKKWFCWIIRNVSYWVMAIIGPLVFLLAVILVNISFMKISLIVWILSMLVLIAYYWVHPKEKNDNKET